MGYLHWFHCAVINAAHELGAYVQHANVTVPLQPLPYVQKAYAVSGVLSDHRARNARHLALCKQRWINYSRDRSANDRGYPK